MSGNKSELSQDACAKCGKAKARTYELYFFTEVGVPAETDRTRLCVKCARAERRQIRVAHQAQLNSRSVAGSQESVTDTSQKSSEQLSRAELIAVMDRFWGESGAGEICRRCHEQRTGCCPPMCRHLGATGCLKKNVFCTSFICSALRNAISECDAETGRLLKWMKWHPGSAEFRLYEMVTRVPAIDREPVRPLALPVLYPGPLHLSGTKIRAKLLTLADEVLEIRRRWHKLERAPFAQDDEASEKET